MRRKTAKTCDEGFHICRNCLGYGYKLDARYPGARVLKNLCDVCDGTGQIDWIENITEFKRQLVGKRIDAEEAINAYLDSMPTNVLDGLVTEKAVTGLGILYGYSE